jgi:hypothetical protein
MTRYTGNEPIEPFVVMAKTVKCSVEKGEPDNGGGSGKIPSTPQRPALSTEEMESIEVKVAVGAVLAGAFLLAYSNPRFADLTILALPGIVLYRLDSQRRRIAAAPVTLAAMMLVSKITGAGTWYVNYGIAPTSTAVNELKIWMPLFLAGCLFFMPKSPTYTEKILMLMSLILLLSGLLPADGFGIVFWITQYFLFIAIVVGLGIDLTQFGRIFAQASSAGK